MIKKKIVDLLKKIIKEDIEIEVFVPEKEEFGHYSTNVALKLTKELKKSPMEIAQELTNDLKLTTNNFFKKIEVASPGFINFWLSERVLQNELKEILQKKERYGKSKVQSLKPKVQVEFVSANPTGPLTLANGRGGFMGDVLSNVLEFCGYKVEREYYVNDTGNQVLTLGKSILAALGLLEEAHSTSSGQENFYKGEYVKEWARKNSAKVKKNKNNTLKIGQLAANDFLKLIKVVLEKKAKIRYNRWTSEDKHIRKKSYIEKVLKIFKAKKLAYEKDGALWLKTTQFSDDKDRVLMTKDNFPTYFLADSGHFLETKTRGFKNKIMILGPDHHGYVQRIKIAAEIIGLKNFEVIITQAVRLISKGEEVKMSKRKGEFITFDELVSEINPDAARFFFLMHSADAHMDFDLDLAKEQSMKNPVYYAQYASARIHSILAKFKIQKSKFKITDKNLKINLNLLNTADDMNLMRMLARFLEIIQEAVEKRNPSILARYAIDLARIFHNFYEKEKIIGAESDLMITRLELIKATKIIFENLFKLLGISMPKKM